jgi:hypothetical protein
MPLSRCRQEEVDELTEGYTPDSLNVLARQGATKKLTSEILDRNLLVIEIRVRRDNDHEGVVGHEVSVLP